MSSIIPTSFPIRVSILTAALSLSIISNADSNSIGDTAIPSKAINESVSVRTTTYKKYQWQLIKLDGKTLVYTVCTDGVYKRMLCYPDSSRMTHIPYVFLEQDLFNREQKPVSVEVATEDKSGNLVVTYVINKAGLAKFVPPVISNKTTVDLVSGSNGIGKSAKSVLHDKQTPDRASWTFMYYLLIIPLLLLVGAVAVAFYARRIFLNFMMNGILSRISLPSTPRNTTDAPAPVVTPSEPTSSEQSGSNDGKRKILVD